MRIRSTIPYEEVLDRVFFTADSHLGHANIIRYCNRPFDTIREHDNQLLKAANAIVKKGSICWVLGDFTLKQDARSYLDKLGDGEWHFLPGSHDKWMRSFRPTKDRIREPGLVILEFSRKQDRPFVVVLCHYAMRQWDRSHYGSLHLYGHSHGDLEDYGRSTDIGVDSWLYQPIPLRTIIRYLGDRKIVSHHD